jgi:hypothetical protein
MSKRNPGLEALRRVGLFTVMADIFEKYVRHPAAKNGMPFIRVHGRGRRMHKGAAGLYSAKLSHRLCTGHSGSARLCTRKERKYAARGYGYIAPQKKREWIPAKEDA